MVTTDEILRLRALRWSYQRIADHVGMTAQGIESRIRYTTDPTWAAKKRQAVKDRLATMRRAQGKPVSAFSCGLCGECDHNRRTCPKKGT